ncbi:flagellar basal-body rod protein FlgF [Methylocucumis oryzae]|uniref:Flagellar basal-body rod protein FlgF n=1 Tax=Methylocucumis oryzae TaxID=1632867 RepID=A0A0F3IK99_9GAMM|nr:flagellar basal-body rod protein FlgF [Methylocucumis oryzae]KJV07087.1 flagellar basal body rod protein FlgF [Methylocucumis oryzae]
MDRSLYIAMSGAKQTLMAQTANANNLANAQTTGFKSDWEQFRSMPVFGPGFPTRAYALTERPGTDFTQGPLQTTGRDLDIAIKGEGYLAVQGPDGKEAYTRAGDLQITPEGFLKTGTGLSVIGQGGPISIPPAQKVEIGSDGTISIVPLGANPTNIAVIDRLKLVKPAANNIEKLKDGLVHVKDGQAQVANANVTVAQGVLEGSNVNSIYALVEMIDLQRHFELQTKVMSNVDENSARSTKLMQIA